MNSTKELLPPPRQYHYVGEWTEVEDNYLIEHPKVPTKVLAKRLGRSPKAVCSRRSALKNTHRP